MEDIQCLLALIELDVLGELVEELVELDVARELDIIVLELLREVLLDVHEFVSLGWLRLDLILGGLVAPQVLELLAIVVLDVVPRHLVQLGVDMLALTLHVGVVVAVLEREQKPPGLYIVDALESQCRIED